MSKLFSNPKVVTAVIVLGVMSLAGALGGAIGNEFGGGFLGSPMAHIQLAAEPVTPDPIVGDFTITNTMVATWAAIILLTLVAFIVRHRLTEVPGRLQSLLEVVLEFFLNLAETVAGRERGRRFFPLVMTIFVFIVTSNWLGVLPGYGSIGWVESADEVIAHAVEEAEDNEEHADLTALTLQVFDGDGSFAVFPFGSVDNVITAQEYKTTGVSEGQQAGLLVPYLRSANTDVNTTLAIALIAMFMVHFWGLNTLGVLNHIGKYVNITGKPFVIAQFVGILEGISELARVISFTFRLFGNIFAGEVLLVAMAFLLPLVGLVLPLVLELFVGLIQAFIFAMLTLVFAATATIAHESDGH